MFQFIHILYVSNSLIFLTESFSVYEVESHGRFNLRCPWTGDFEYPLLDFWPLYVLFGEMSIQIFPPCFGLLSSVL